jgi:hypothetical protein
VAGDRPDLARVVPSGRSLLLALAIAAAAAAAYWAAHATSVFAVEQIEVRGAPPDVKRQVDAATRELLGRSLVAVDADDVEGSLRALPAIAGASVDRAFPHSLVVKVAPERPVAVARRGHSAYLVTGTGSVVREIEPGSEQALPRLWIPRGVSVYVGGRLPTAYAPPTRALAAAREVGFRRGLKGVRSTNGELTLVLRRGPEIRLGAAADLGLKIAVTRLVLRHLAAGMEYVDVSVPERPIAG